MIAAGKYRMGWCFLLLLLVVFCFLCGFFHVSAVDVGFHLRTGEYVLGEAAIPVVNTFSSTQPDTPWLLHQWAPAVVYYLAYASGGLTGLIVFKAALGALIFLVVWLSARRETRTDSPWAFWAVTACVLAARVRFFERPYMVSALCLAFLLYGCRRWRGRHAWTLGGLPVLMAVWANLHAGVLYGCGVLAIMATMDMFRWWRRGRVANEAFPGLVMGGMASAVMMAGSVALINPCGVRVLLVPLQYLGEHFWQNLIVELQPPVGVLRGGVVVYAVALVLLQVMDRRRLDREWVVLSSVFLFLAFRSQRSVLMCMVVSAPHLARVLDGSFRRWQNRVDVAAFLTLPLVWGVLIGTVLVPDTTRPFGVGLHRNLYPMGLYRFMNERVETQPMYNDMMYGGGLLWFVYPHLRPFIDSRGEAYDFAFWRDVYVPVSEGADVWRTVYARYGVTLALVRSPTRPGGELAQRLYDDPQWHPVAFDDYAVLFVKDVERNKALIAETAFSVLWPGDEGQAAITSENAGVALAEARRAVALDPDGWYSRTALARALLKSVAYAEALAVYQDLILSGRPGAAYYRDYGYCLYMVGDGVGAERIFQDLLERGEETEFARYMLEFMVQERRRALTSAPSVSVPPTP